MKRHAQADRALNRGAMVFATVFLVALIVLFLAIVHLVALCGSMRGAGAGAPAIAIRLS